MGIADAGADMTPQSAAPATKLIERTFTGHLPVVGARPVQARQPRTAWMVAILEPLPQHGGEAAWSAEFTSLGRCNEAGTALEKKFNSPPGQRQFVFAVEFLCVKK